MMKTRIVCVLLLFAAAIACNGCTATEMAYQADSLSTVAVTTVLVNRVTVDDGIAMPADLKQLAQDEMVRRFNNYRLVETAVAAPAAADGDGIAVSATITSFTPGSSDPNDILRGEGKGRQTASVVVADLTTSAILLRFNVEASATWGGLTAKASGDAEVTEALAKEIAGVTMEQLNQDDSTKEETPEQEVERNYLYN